MQNIHYHGKDVVAIRIEFVEIQNRVLKTFRETFSQITDWKFLLDSPRSGYIWALGEEWKLSATWSRYLLYGTEIRQGS
ncbi:hypothetical protein [Iningainema tapete]|uniref:Uncharacterized protein n=1 Tax=Iningainema tapete BLCC-T55 TaxID=2748662 RepID=A0A8J6XIJ5_9CYAN|nr:hypothetical protein [Iningainema tapete]MBD2773021.1 hypothetical protein [Iningainema tapete BLCC-T55]